MRATHTHTQTTTRNVPCMCWVIVGITTICTFFKSNSIIIILNCPANIKQYHGYRYESHNRICIDIQRAPVIIAGRIIPTKRGAILDNDLNTEAHNLLHPRPSHTQQERTHALFYFLKLFLDFLYRLNIYIYLCLYMFLVHVSDVQVV